MSRQLYYDIIISIIIISIIIIIIITSDTGKSKL